MIYDRALCSYRAYLLTRETGFRITTVRQCDVNSNEIGVYWMPGSPEKGFDLLFLGSREGQRNLWCELFLQGWEQFTKSGHLQWAFERRVWANTSWESLVGSGHLQWEDNRETTLAWKEGWRGGGCEASIDGTVRLFPGSGRSGKEAATIL